MLKKFGIGLAFIGALMFAGVSNVFVSSVSAEEKKEEKKDEKKDEKKKEEKKEEKK